MSEPSAAAMEAVKRISVQMVVKLLPWQIEQYATLIDREFAQERERTRVLREAVHWVVNDAFYKPPEQVGDTAYRWLARLSSALAEFDKETSK